MEFRPCIDVHNGKVKQIVGGTLTDQGDLAKENYVSERSAADFSELYRGFGLKGGHTILLNSKDSEYYPASKGQVLSALRAWPGGLMAGGGIDDENASEFLEAGASHVIVTSFVFRDGMIDGDRLKRLVGIVGKNRLCLDLSCRKKDGRYYVVTDRWQKFTGQEVNEEILYRLSESCDEFLIHAVDVEGRQSGIEEELIPILLTSPNPVTYAGGVGNIEDIRRLKELGEGKIHVTVGSALKIFGGSIDLKDIINIK